MCENLVFIKKKNNEKTLLSKCVTANRLLLTEWYRAPVCVDFYASDSSQSTEHGEISSYFAGFGPEEAFLFHRKIFFRGFIVTSGPEREVSSQERLC